MAQYKASRGHLIKNLVVPNAISNAVLALFTCVSIIPPSVTFSTFKSLDAKSLTNQES